MKRIILFSIVFLSMFGITSGCALKKENPFTEPPTAPPSSIKTPANRPNEKTLIEPSITLLFDFGDDRIPINFKVQISDVKIPLLWSIMQEELTNKGIALEYYDSGRELGVLITKIGDKKNGENGEYAKVGVSQYGLKAGDAVEWKFTDNKLKSKN